MVRLPIRLWLVVALVVLHFWRKAGLRLPRLLAIVVTFLFVSACLVVFRAASLGDARAILASVAGLHGLHPLTHAAGASLGGTFFVIGGRSDSLAGQTASILAIDPTTGRVHTAGHLPLALSDLGATTVGGRILAVGGRDAHGGVHDEIWTLEGRP